MSKEKGENQILKVALIIILVGAILASGAISIFADVTAVNAPYYDVYCTVGSQNYVGQKLTGGFSTWGDPNALNEAITAGQGYYSSGCTSFEIYEVFLSSDGSSITSRVLVWVNGQPVATTVTQTSVSVITSTLANGAVSYVTIGVPVTVTSTSYLTSTAFSGSTSYLTTTATSTSTSAGPTVTLNSPGSTTTVISTTTGSASTVTFSTTASGSVTTVIKYVPTPASGFTRTQYLGFAMIATAGILLAAFFIRRKDTE